MVQVGADYTAKQVSGGGLDLTKRVSWASEPKYQLCMWELRASRITPLELMPTTISLPHSCRVTRALLSNAIPVTKLALWELPSMVTRYAPGRGTYFADSGYEALAEDKLGACRNCHGDNGQGTVLSEVAADRSFVIEECEGGTLCSGGKARNFQVTLAKGTKVNWNL